MNDKTEKIWEEFYSKLRRFILKRVLKEDVADDILQEVFIKIHTHIGSLKDKSKLQSWIYQITRNTIADYYRDQKPIGELQEAIDASADLSDDDADELASCINTLLDCLPENYRKALILTEYQGLSQKEMGEKLGISLSGAKSRVQRARKRLKDMLLECCHQQLAQRTIAIDYQAQCDCCCQENSSRKR